MIAEFNLLLYAMLVGVSVHHIASLHAPPIFESCCSARAFLPSFSQPSFKLSDLTDFFFRRLRLRPTQDPRLLADFGC